MDIDPGSVVLPGGAPPAPAAAPAPAEIQIDPGSVQLPEPPSILESAGRGALQGASFGFADEIAGAIGAATSKKTYTEARNESRDAYSLAKDTNPRAYFAGEVGGGLAGALAPGALLGKAAGAGAAAAEGAEVAPTIGRLALRGAASGAAYGGAQALGDSTADLTKGDFHGAIADTLRGAAVGGALGAVLEPAANKLLEGAPKRAADDILEEIAQGEGTAGGATVTAKKLLAKDREDIVRTIQESPELRSAVGKPAREALPVVNHELDRVGSQLDPNYTVVDKATGGVKLSEMVDFLDGKVAELRKTPLNEQYIHAVEDIRNSALEAWAPDLNAALRSEEARTVPAVKAAVLDHLDVQVPTVDVRKMVTRLQTRGSQVINPLNPGEASIMKADMAGMLKEFIDGHLDAAAAGAPDVATAVANIRQINSTYSALANIQKAIQQRAWKEATGSTSMGGHLQHLGQLLGGVVGASHGPIGAGLGVLAGVAGPKVLHGVSARGNEILARIATEAAAGRPVAQLARAAFEQGVPRAAITRIVSGVTQALGGAQ